MTEGGGAGGEGPGRRERHKAATRQALTEAALRLAEERGVDGCTVEDVTESVDVSIRTFFNYFSSKEEAILPDPAEQVALLRQAWEGQPRGVPLPEVLRETQRTLMAHYEARGSSVVRRLHLVRSSPTLQMRLLAHFRTFELELADDVAARVGLRRDDLYPALVGAVVMTATRVALFRWLDDPTRHRLTGLLDEAFDALAVGLAPPPS